MSEPATLEYVVGVGIGTAATYAGIGVFWYFDLVPPLAVLAALMVATIGGIVTVATDDHVRAALEERGSR